jgi:hypothetical protein
VKVLQMFQTVRIPSFSKYCLIFLLFDVFAGGNRELPGNYRSEGSAKADMFEEPEGVSWTLQRHVSFVDCPG